MSPKLTTKNLLRLNKLVLSVFGCLIGLFDCFAWLCFLKKLTGFFLGLFVGSDYLGLCGWFVFVQCFVSCSVGRVLQRLRCLSAEPVASACWESWSPVRPAAIYQRKWPPEGGISFEVFILIGCGSQIWTDDLQVMSLTSYRAAPSRAILYGLDLSER